MIPIFIPIQSKRELSFQVVQTKRTSNYHYGSMCLYALMEDGEGDDVRKGRLLCTFEQGAVFCYCIALMGVSI
jgi:hypothetical protein